jgi:subtilisin-like proprotein convertase family protein
MQTKSTNKLCGNYLWKFFSITIIFSLFTAISFCQSSSSNRKSYIDRQTELKKQDHSRLVRLQSSDNDAGLPNRIIAPITNSPQAVCTTFTASIVSTDPTTTLRSNRGGTPRTCAAPGTCIAGVAGTFNYKIFQWTNPVAQCVTVTYAATNANFSFVSVYNAPPTLTNLCTNWVADPGSSAAVGTPIVFSFNATAGTTYYFLVTNITALPADCTIQIDAPVCSATACTGTPAPGNTISTTSSACPSIPFTLSLQNNPAVSGLTYQWQSSSTLAGPYTNITGANGSTYTTTLTANTYYQAIVTCSGNTGTSTPVLVSLNPPSACYCAAGATSTTFEKISNVTFAGINRTTTSTAGYENWLTDTARVIAGGTYQISVSIAGGFAADQVFVWADLNRNGNFTDPGELLYTSPTGVGPHVANITIPATAQLGNTRLRVRMHDSSIGGNSTPCGNSTYGQVEDYTLNISACGQGVFTAQPINSSIACGSNTSFTAPTTGSLITYQWQVRTSPTAAWTNVTNGGIYSGATTNTLTLTNASAAVTGYQYRAVINGACTATDFSNVATITVTPLVADITPASATICLGTIQQLKINNIDAAVPGSVVVNSATLNLNVADNNPAGVNSSLTVPALPAGAVVTGVRVRLNVTSTWLGDLNVNLKAPNNQILNLSHNLSVTNGNATGGGSFVNTIIGSAFTTPLHTATSPDNTHTGNYKADAGTVSVGGITPNITGFVPTTASWNALFTPSTTGVWTIAIADIFPGGDVTTFQNWSITIDYVAGTPSNGTFTGPAGTMFTDALATIPYTGTAINTIYVKPIAPGVNNYSVVVTSPPCTSAALTIPVTVNTPVSAVSTVTNASACAGSSASFTVTATGGPITYQWQQSTDGGTTWTNISNGGNFSGATTGTLTVSGTTAAMNNYRYRAVLSSASCGSVNSNGATLTVNPNPTIVVSANPYTRLYPGLTTTLTAATSPAGTYTYTWFRNGIVVPGATANTLIVNVDQLGSYTVTATNTGTTCTSTSSSINIADSITGNLFIYPSPNHGQFQVRYINPAGAPVVRMINIYDAKGSRVYFRNYNLTAPYNGRLDVDMRNTGRGIYLVELTDGNHNRIKAGYSLVL